MQDWNLLVGTYTRDTQSSGIYHLTDSEEATCIAQADNPSFLALHPQDRVVYCVNECRDFLLDESHKNQTPTGGVSAYSIKRNNQSNGVTLTLINQQYSMGADPCHLTLAATGEFVVVSNYTGGTLAILPIQSGGGLAPYICAAEHQGTGPNLERQESAHVHSSLMDAQYLYVADLGVDQVVRYTFDHIDGSDLTGADLTNPTTITAEPGAGPRFMVQTKDNLFVLNELNNTLSRYRKSDLKHEQTVTVLPLDDTGADNIEDIEGIEGNANPENAKSIAAHIELSADQQYIYVSNRGHDSIAVFRNSQQLEHLQTISSGGRHPRHFTFVNDENLILVANKDTHNIVGFDRNQKTGLLTQTDIDIRVPSPVCLLPLPD